MSRRILAEPFKLYLLIILWTLCLSTLFFSSSWQLGRRDLPTLRPTPAIFQQYCGNRNQQRQDDDNIACHARVQQAYRRINLGGCNGELLNQVLCELEWCEAGATPTTTAAKAACQTECAAVRGELQTCIQSTVQRYVKRSSFFLRNKATTMKTTTTRTATETMRQTLQNGGRQPKMYAG